MLVSEVGLFSKLGVFSKVGMSKDTTKFFNIGTAYTFAEWGPSALSFSD
jgi:hypothetical protein